MVLLLGVAAFCSTMLGGALALKLRDRLHLILGFSAGAVIAVAFFDLMPEALNAGAGIGAKNILAAVALGFFLYLLLDRLLLLGHGAAQHESRSETFPQAARLESDQGESRGHARAGSLSLHSFLDGVGIGLAFQVNAAVGAAVAVAVLVHDFSDGINTVSVVMRHLSDGKAGDGDFSKALRWLLVDALAPVFGIVAALFFAVSDEQLGLLLALFGGFFLYIGASDLIPESHHAHPTFWTTVATLLGAAVLFFAVRLVNL